MTARPACALLLAAALALPAAAADPTPTGTLRDAAAVIDELQRAAATSIPARLLADAEAVTVLPDVVKAGFIVGGRGGHGVAVVRAKDGSWGDVRFLTLGGAIVGLQAGVQASDVVLVFKTRRGLDRITDGESKLTLGADAAVAAGPVGRDAEAATDGKLSAEIYSYSRSRGLFAGVALSGAMLSSDRRLNGAFERDAGPDTLKAAQELKAKLAAVAGVRPPVKTGSGRSE